VVKKARIRDCRYFLSPSCALSCRNRHEEDVNAVFAKYPANSTADVQLQLEQIMTDYEFTDAVKFVQGSIADLDQSTYRYLYSSVLTGQPYGAFHGSETILLFKILILSDPVNDAVSENLIDLWTRFAMTGEPKRRDECYVAAIY